MIDEKKLIERMWDKFNSFYNAAIRFEKEETLMANRVLSDVQKMIEGQPKVGEWIPVSERLPDETGGDYYPAMNVTTRKGEVGWGFYRCDDGYWYLYNEEMQEWEIGENGQVIAWMPLPEPFRKEGAE